MKLQYGLLKKGEKWTFNRLNDTYEIPEIVGGLTPKSEKIEGGILHKNQYM